MPDPLMPDPLMPDPLMPDPLRRTGEHETHRAVQLANAMQMFDLVKRTQDEIAEVASALKEHMRQEAKDRQIFIKELHDIRMDIQKLEAKIDGVVSGTDSRFDICKAELRKDMNSETDANINSLKLELKADIAKVAHSLERFSDHVKQDSKDGEAKLVRIFDRLELIERTQAANNQWVDLMKRVAYAVIGAITIGTLVAMGVQLNP
jgi:hypothetical protein